jgi:hypothetical protein
MQSFALILLARERFPRVRELQLLKLGTGDIEVRAVAETEIPHARFVVPSRKLPVEHAVGLLPQPRAAETVTARPSVEEEGTVPALLAELGLAKLEATLAIHALVAALRVVDFHAIHACLHIENSIAVEAILILIGLNREVAVLGPTALVHVLAVLQSHCVEIEEWNCIHELLELREEGAGEIEFATIIQVVPCIAIPRFMVVHLVRMVRREYRHDVLPREVTFPHVQRPLYPPCQSSLKPALRTEGRRRNLHFPVERLITVIDDKAHPTLPTAFLFYHGIKYASGSSAAHSLLYPIHDSDASIAASHRSTFPRETFAP